MTDTNVTEQNHLFSRMQGNGEVRGIVTAKKLRNLVALETVEVKSVYDLWLVIKTKSAGVEQK